MTEKNLETNTAAEKSVKSILITTLKEQKSRLLHFLKWVIVSGVIGIVIGLVGAAFWHGMEKVNHIRQGQPLIVLGLPVAGLLIVFMILKV